MRYEAQPIVQTRTKAGNIEPKAPAGIAVPKGWRLIEVDGRVYYVREDER